MNIKKKIFCKWLESKGLVLQRMSSSHEIWNYPDSQEQLKRPVTVDANYDDIPEFHINTNLKTMGVTKSLFRKEIKKF